LSDSLRNGDRFALYLRAYTSEKFLPPTEMVRDSINLQRSVEIANLTPVFERIPLFGLFNAVDPNLLRKYKAVWLPPTFRHMWKEIVLALADRACLVIVNATHHGRGFAEELQVVPLRYPGKTWLLAGWNSTASRYSSANVERAVELLRDFPAHVSVANVDTDGVQYAEPRCPDWVIEKCVVSN
jgi:hypothetical protein